MNNSIIKISNRFIFTPSLLHPKLRVLRQRGIIVVFTLIAVVLLLIASVALVRSFDTALSIAGNMGFKRDLVNQSERGISNAIKTVSSGGNLYLDSARWNSSAINNYSAVALDSDVHGIPNILLNDTLWTASNMNPTDITDTSTGISVRYVIDRQCPSVGPAGPLTSTCVLSNFLTLDAGSPRPYGTQTLPDGFRIVYRISVKVTGPRHTQTFVQSVITLPGTSS